MFRLLIAAAKAWIDCAFPPLCKVCKERCRTRLLCPSCWELCSPLDPVHRCRHCFQEIEEDALCQRCRCEPRLSFPSAFVFESTTSAFCVCREAKEAPEALAAFLFVQWERLQWPVPDAVIPLPGASRLAASFSSWLGSSYASVLSYGGGFWECASDRLEEDKILLLLGERASWETLREAAAALGETFPKKVYALSLLREDV